MEEEKAAAYYDELTRKGEAAARFKHGLGFSSSTNKSDAVPIKGSSFPSSSSSFLSQFVKASSPSSASKIEKECQLQSIQNKLKKKPCHDRDSSRVSERSHGHRSSSRDRDNETRHSRRRSRSRSRSKERYRDRGRESESKNRERERRRRSRSRSRSLSPRRERRRGEDRKRERAGDNVKKVKNVKVDYSRLIEGYDKMSAAERVKAKMKLQLSDTAKQDTMGSGWERFEFDKDAPLDDGEVEVADDDAALVKHIGQSFRFSAIEARREEQIKAAHDEAMFGAPVLPISGTAEKELEVDDNQKNGDEGSLQSLLSEKVLAKQQGSWRDRARKG